MVHHRCMCVMFLRSTSSFHCFNYRLTVGFPLGVQWKTNSLSTWKEETHTCTVSERTYLSSVQSALWLSACRWSVFHRLLSLIPCSFLELCWGRKSPPRLRLCLLCSGGRWGSLIHNQPSSTRVIIPPAQVAHDVGVAVPDHTRNFPGMLFTIIVMTQTDLVTKKWNAKQ